MRWVRTVVLVAGQAAPRLEVLRKGWERSLLDPTGLEEDLQWLPGRGVDSRTLLERDVDGRCDAIRL